MFVTRTTGYPALGKQREYRLLLEEWVKNQQAKGARISLQVQLFAHEGLAYVVVVVHETLADYEKYRAGLSTDAQYLALVDKLGPISRAAARGELFESIVPIPMR